MPDTPIDLPQLPRQNVLYLEAARAIQESRVLKSGGAVATTPPDFARLTYADAKVAVDLTLLDVRDYYARLDAEYLSKIGFFADHSG